MSSFIQLSYGKPARTHADEGLKPWTVALILGLILGLQVGLVLWLYLKPPPSRLPAHSGRRWGRI